MAKPSRTRQHFVLETSQAIFEKGALRQVVVEAQEGFAVLRLRGPKQGFAAPWGAVYHLAVAQEAERELRARKAQMGV